MPCLHIIAILLLPSTKVHTHLLDFSKFSSYFYFATCFRPHTVTVLELERNNTDTGMKIDGKDPREEKSRGLFGFGGGKKKKNDLDWEKQRQSKLMEFKLREIELEKEVDDIRSKLKDNKKQSTEHECKVAEWQAELDDESHHLDVIACATEKRLKEEMKQLNSSYEEEKRRLSLGK